MFQAASISKPVTALAFLRLVQEGKLRLDEDVNRYLTSWKVPESSSRATSPSPRGRCSAIHPEQATGSASRLRAVATSSLAGANPERRETVQCGSGNVERPPFSAAKYSGGGITIIQLLIMDLLGRPFEAIMREYALAPAE